MTPTVQTHRLNRVKNFDEQTDSKTRIRVYREKATVIEPVDNACSEARITKRVQRPTSITLLFGDF